MQRHAFPLEVSIVVQQLELAFLSFSIQMHPSPDFLVSAQQVTPVSRFQKHQPINQPTKKQNKTTTKHLVSRSSLKNMSISSLKAKQFKGNGEMGAPCG